MSVVGRDYDELKQYNLAEIYDPTSKLEAKTSSGPAPKVENKDDNPHSNVTVNVPRPKDDLIITQKNENHKTSLDSPTSQLRER